jgi:polysaccharide export outer membrane protein
MKGCRRGVAAAIVLALAAGSGCVHGPLCAPPDGHFPRELEKTSLPAYTIEPPDILLLDAVKTVPLPPYRIQPLDALLIRVTETLPNEPIEGTYVVEPEGTVNLGGSYGAIRVVDLSKEQAQAAIRKELEKILKRPEVTVSIAQSRAQQQIRGEHLVYPDGTVNLGLYGSAVVAGLTIPEAKLAIEAQLSNFLEKPEVSVSIGGFNSKVFYIVTDGAGYGQQVIRLPITGNETVLDAIAQINGIASQGSPRHVWVARPAPAQNYAHQIMEVDWLAITKCGDTTTNYQLMPGDRIFIQGDSLVALNNWVTKVVSPIERLFGVTLLGAETITQIRNPNGGNGTGNGVGGFR